MRFLLVVILFGGIMGVAWSQDKTATQTGQAALESLGETLFANEKSESELAKLLTQAYAAESAANPGREQQLNLAQILIYQSIFHRQRNRPQESDQALSKAEALVQAVYTPNDSLANQELADIRSRLMGLRGLGYIMANSGAINDLALKTLQLEPNNVVAATIVAFGKINTPPLFGGSPDVAIDTFQKLLARGDITKINRFTALLGMASAYKKKNDGPQRQKALEAARAIFPANPDLLKAGQD